MASDLDYAERRAENGKHGILYGLAVMTGLCFVLPPVMLYVEVQVHPGSLDAMPVWMLRAAGVIWLAAAVFGLVGSVVGIVLWKKSGPCVGVVLATLINAGVVAYFLLIVVSALVRFWRR